MKHLILRRIHYAKTATTGELSVVDESGRVLVKVSTLELPWMNNSPRVSCIPAGKYRIAFEYSTAFKRYLWELKDVPGRSEVKIHAANYTRQLKGCIAPCLSHGDIDGDRIVDGLNSANALQKIMDALAPQKDSVIEVL